MKSIITSFILMFAVLALQAQKGYKIDFEIEGQEGKTVLMAYHLGNKQYVTDSIHLDAKGKAVWEGDSTLQNGMYLAVFPDLNNNYFNFIVGGDQRFSVTTQAPKIWENLSIKGSKSNAMYLRDMAFLTEASAQRKTLEEQYNAAENEEEKEGYRQELIELNDEVLSFRNELRMEDPYTFYSKVLAMLEEVDIPEPPRDENGVITDSLFQWRYLRKHYWDNVDFSEAGLIRTMYYRPKLMDFFKQTVHPAVDSINAAADQLLQASMSNEIMFQYNLSTLLNHYSKSTVMGHDAIYVHLALEYYGKGLATWADSTTVKKIVKDATERNPTLIGKIAPNLILRDTTKTRTFELHQVKAPYTILYIWDPDCGHCKKETPKLKAFYDKYKQYGIEVYAASTTYASTKKDEIGKWKAFIKKHDLNFINVADLYVQTHFRDAYNVKSTPKIYVLNQEKEIVAKRLGVNQLAHFFRQYLKRNNDPNYVYFEPEKDSSHMEEEH